MEKDKSLIIWTKNGSTMKFEKVEDFDVNDVAIRFEYFGVSTQVKRTAMFMLSSIAGFALEE